MYEREDLENTMDKPALLALANEEMGLGLPNRTNKDDIVEAIMAAQNGEEPPAASDESGEMSDVEKQAAAATSKSERVRLTVHADGGPDGDEPVKVGINGKMYLIKRDKPVDVPRSVVGVLKDAVQTVMEEGGTDADGMIVYRERAVRRYNYTVE